MNTLSHRRAVEGDLELYWEIQKEADRWMRSKGHAPLGALFKDKERREFMARQIQESEVYLFEEAGVTWGSLRLQREDQAFWGGQGLDGSAGYLHGLVVRDGWHGKGMGRRLVRWAEAKVGAWGRRLLRLDCKADNERLRRYYRDCGFHELGQVTLENGWKAARFEKMLSPR